MPSITAIREQRTAKVAEARNLLSLAERENRSLTADESARFDAAKAEIAEALRKQLWPLISAGSVRVSIDSEFDLDDAAEAHRRMESSQHIGKIVLKVAGNGP
mgnify:CR=1 FL=1